MMPFNKYSLPLIRKSMISEIVTMPITIDSSKPRVIRSIFGIFFILSGFDENLICTRKAPQKATRAIIIIEKIVISVSIYNIGKGLKIANRIMDVITKTVARNLGILYFLIVMSGLYHKW